MSETKDFEPMTTPKVSVFSTVKNGEKFLVETVESILSQSFKDFEIVIVDGASTDGTVEILKRYPAIHWISEPDRSAEEGFHKALAMCRGEYLIQCCVSDGFLDTEWFKTCVDILDRDAEVSLVYGAQQNMSEDGVLRDLVYRELLLDPPPQKEDFFPFWLATRFHFPETNYCVRRNVFLDCFPVRNSTDFFDLNNPFLKCVYSFNTKGYLPYFVPVVANYFKTHEQQLTEIKRTEGTKTIDIYHTLVADYGNKVLNGEIKHVHRNGEGKVIAAADEQALALYRKKVLKYTCTRHIYLLETAESVIANLETLTSAYRLLLQLSIKLRRVAGTALRTLHLR